MARRARTTPGHPHARVRTHTRPHHSSSRTSVQHCSDRFQRSDVMASETAAESDADWEPWPDLPLPSPRIDLTATAAALGIRYFLVSYEPLNAASRVSVIPRSAIAGVQRYGCGVASAMYFRSTGADPEIYVVPDPTTLVQLPWKPEYAWLSSNIYLAGKPFAQCPRRALMRQIHRAKLMGYEMKSGIEPEFMMLDAEGRKFGDARDGRQPMCLQEPLAIMRNSAFLEKVHDCMETLGWKPYEVDHEATNCQYEINFDYSDALTTADRYGFMKFMIKELAELEGYTATFMPVALPGLICASGLHVNVSLWNCDAATNALQDSSDPQLGISKVARNFVGGLMRHAPASCAIMCPTINSYKRLNAGSWCPNIVSWGGNNRTVLFRVPASNRIEHRLPDGSTNLYLTHAVILAAGLDGIDTDADPGPLIDVEIDSHPGYKDMRRLPSNLIDALHELESSEYLRRALGGDMVDSFVYLKRREWKQYAANLSEWERDYYLNC